MNKPLLFFLLFIAISPTVLGQIDSAAVKLYNSWYFFNSDMKNHLKVYTYDFKDTTVTIVARNAYFRGFVPASNDLQVIPLQDINKIVFRRKGKQLTMLLTGYARCQVLLTSDADRWLKFWILNFELFRKRSFPFALHTGNEVFRLSPPREYWIALDIMKIYSFSWQGNGFKLPYDFWLAIFHWKIKGLGKCWSSF